MLHWREEKQEQEESCRNRCNNLFTSASEDAYRHQWWGQIEMTLPWQREECMKWKLHNLFTSATVDAYRHTSGGDRLK